MQSCYKFGCFLQAYAIYDAEIGYVQGLSFLAAALLLHVSKTLLLHVSKALLLHVSKALIKCVYLVGFLINIYGNTEAGIF